MGVVTDSDLKTKTVQQMAAEPAADFAGTTPAYATADLPDPSTVPAGFKAYDSTTGEVVVSDGSTWNPTTGFNTLRIKTWESDEILFSDLGSGATDTIVITPTFPTSVVVLGAAPQIVTAFGGEADLAVILGLTANDDGFIEALNLDGVVAGIPDHISGILSGWSFQADMETDGLSAIFTATELDDVTSGSIKFLVYYIELSTL